jgi:hypothetical protein
VKYEPTREASARRHPTPAPTQHALRLQRGACP